MNSYRKHLIFSFLCVDLRYEDINEFEQELNDKGHLTCKKLLSNDLGRFLLKEFIDNETNEVILIFQ